jgi:hypothetical protein
VIHRGKIFVSCTFKIFMCGGNVCVILGGKIFVSRTGKIFVSCTGKTFVCGGDVCVILGGKYLCAEVIYV